MDILGLSFDIDAAASLVRDGRVIAAAAEERFSRIKHDRDFPDQASRFCLAWGGTTLPEVDRVALGWNPTVHLEPLQWRRSSRLRHHSEYLAAVPNLLMRQYSSPPRAHVTEQVHRFSDDVPPLRVDYVDHHLCHAAWAFVSPFERPAVLTVDGFGERTTTLLGRCEHDRIDVLQRVERPHSLGSLYAAFTQHLGFRPNCDEGIVMSLAGMGDPDLLDEVRELVRLADDGSYELDLSYFAFFQESTRRVSPRFVQRFGPPRRDGEPVEDRHCALAASLQQVFEEAYLHLLRRLHDATGSADLVVAGGAALNCVANGLVLERTGFERMFIPPAAGDDGAATGAALYVTHALLGRPRSGEVFRDAALGPDCEPEDVQTLVDGARRRTWHPDPARVPAVAARLLAEGRVIGWYRGRAEFGPRALGNRSILADPRSGEIKDHINAEIKFRQPFRPFAPSVLADRCGDLFERGDPSPFMLHAYRVRPEWEDALPGVLHTDGTARVQTVDRRDHADYAALIEAFDRLTGVPAVLNTSLNVRGQPIANTPEHALACFDSTALDYLFLGDTVLAKDDPLSISTLETAIAEETT
jgi:carbamoyltransferase